MAWGGVAAALVLALCLATADAKAAPAPDFAAAAAVARKAVESEGVPSVAVAVAVDGRIVYQAGFGFADKERKIAATARTPYPLASATKPIVATAVMALVERGRIPLDAPAGSLLGDWSSEAARREATYSVRQLLGHTSGLGTYARIDWSEAPRPDASLESAFARYGRPVQPPGLVCEYSNLGYGLLGRIVEQASGATLAEALKSSVFRPLGMDDASLVEGDGAPPRGAVKYDAAGEPIFGTRNDTPGAGGAWASARDLARFGAFHLSGRRRGPDVIGAQSRRLMRTYADAQAIYHYYDGAKYGLGWYWRRSATGEPVVWHEGGMPGASALIALLPERAAAIAVLINATDANPKAQEIADAFARRVAPDAPTLAFDAAAGYARFDSQPEWVGAWRGEVEIDGESVPVSLAFSPGGSAVATFSEGDRVSPSRAEFGALVRGDVLLGTMRATAAGADVDASRPGYLLLRLVRRGDTLSGAFVAYAAPDRLEHLLPYRARLVRQPTAAAR